MEIMETKKMSIAILTSGGDCAGMNPAIKNLSITAMTKKCNLT